MQDRTAIKKTSIKKGRLRFTGKYYIMELLSFEVSEKYVERTHSQVL